MSGPATLYRRNLPHIRMENAVYFVTWRCRTSQPDLSEKERDLVVSALRRFDGARCHLHGYVVMNDHVHVIVAPLEPWTLAALLHSWKSFTANRFQRMSGRTGAIWQDESFDRVIRDDDEYREKRDYILANPAKRWPDMSGYAWVWAGEA